MSRGFFYSIDHLFPLKVSLRKSRSVFVQLVSRSLDLRTHCPLSPRVLPTAARPGWGGEVPSSAQVPPTPTPGSLIVRPSPPVRAQEPSDSWPGLGSGGIAREVCGVSEPQAGQSGCRRSALAWQGSGDRCPWFAAGVTQPQSCHAVRR